MALNIKVGCIGLLDMLKFKNMGKNREKVIDSASTADIKTDFPINTNAKTLHPDYQKLIVNDIVEYKKAGAKKFVFKKKDGTKPANFRAGQYLSLKLDINNSSLTRPYSICSSPYDATREGKIEIAIKTNPDGFAADWMLNNLKIGDEVITSDPQGQFYYEELRDAKNIIALAGGSGITPFLSMAKAIVEGTEDFNLTILFGNRIEEVILFKDELEYLAKNSDGKVKVVHVLSDEEKDGFEHGLISADIIKKYVPEKEEYSIFICGPFAMYMFAQKEIAKLNLPKRLVRNELLSFPGSIAEHPKYSGDINATYNIIVKQAGKKYTISASAKETLLIAFERAGIKAPSRCRSGECGWCRSRLIKGDVFIPESTDGRRAFDKKFNTIHPCVTFPLSDGVVEVPGEYLAN